LDLLLVQDLDRNLLASLRIHGELDLRNGKHARNGAKRSRRQYTRRHQRPNHVQVLWAAAEARSARAHGRRRSATRAHSNCRPSSLSHGLLTFPKVPSPRVFPISYFPTRLTCTETYGGIVEHAGSPS
jgi:hypothetical protein